MDEALRRARASAKGKGRYYGGITLSSGRKGFAVYDGTKEVEWYSFIVNAHGVAG